MELYYNGINEIENKNEDHEFLISDPSFELETIVLNFSFFVKFDVIFNSFRNERGK